MAIKVSDWNFKLVATGAPQALGANPTPGLSASSPSWRASSRGAGRDRWGDEASFLPLVRPFAPYEASAQRRGASDLSPESYIVLFSRIPYCENKMRNPPDWTSGRPLPMAWRTSVADRCRAVT